MAKPQLIAGVDSSTQSVKVVIRNADTGELLRQGRASHPDGTEVEPALWENALDSAIAEAGGLDDVAAISIGGQQHGMVTLDSSGEVIRPALLWNDTRSAQSARDLNAEMGGDAEAAKKVSLSQPDDDLLTAILNEIQNRVNANPVISNPKDKAENLNRLDYAQNLDFLEHLSKFQEVAQRAHNATAEAEAAVIWAEAFEHSFPMPEVGENLITEQGMNKSGALVPITLPDIHVTAVNKANTNLHYTGTNRIGPVPRNCTITFTVKETWRLPLSATVEWIVRNGEGEAEVENDLGHSSGTGIMKTETSAYNGTHFMDVIFRVNGKVIGARRVAVTVRDVPIPKRNPPRPQYVRLRGRR